MSTSRVMAKREIVTGKKGCSFLRIVREAAAEYRTSSSATPSCTPSMMGGGFQKGRGLELKYLNGKLVGGEGNRNSYGQQS